MRTPEGEAEVMRIARQYLGQGTDSVDEDEGAMMGVSGHQLKHRFPPINFPAVQMCLESLKHGGLGHCLCLEVPMENPTHDACCKCHDRTLKREED